MEDQQTICADDVLATMRELESNRRRLVYLYLAVQGEATMDEVKEDLGLTCLTLFRVLPDLQERDFVEQANGQWTCKIQ